MGNDIHFHRMTLCKKLLHNKKGFTRILLMFRETLSTLALQEKMK